MMLSSEKLMSVASHSMSFWMRTFMILEDCDRNILSSSLMKTKCFHLRRWPGLQANSYITFCVITFANLGTGLSDGI